MSDEVSNAFIGRREKPADADLAKALGSAKPLWDQLIASLAENHGVTDCEWRSYSPKAGWSLRLKRGKRTIVWLSPCNLHRFQVLYILGERALEAARRSRLPARGRLALEQAPKYPEGTGVRLLVKAAKDLPMIEKLAVAKIQN
ncbi:MAG: DUF3788 family protein [Bryobacteraceae bacterium]|nr:DUF3788 family protein [Bryobacteraceae bacterium]